MTGGGTLRVLDVSDPVQPSEIGVLAIGGAAPDVDLVGDLAFVAEQPFTLRIVDVSDPSAPIECGALVLDDPIAPPTLVSELSVALEGDIAFLGESIGHVAILDLADPDHPAPIAALDFVGYQFGNIEVLDGALYLPVGAGEIQIYDVSDPTAAQPLARVAGLPGIRIAVASGVLYVLGLGVQELHLFDVSDPASPVALGVLFIQDGQVGTRLSVEDGLAHVITGSLQVGSPGSLQAVDVRVPEFPERQLFLEYDYRALEVAGQLLYAASGGALDVFDLADPMRPGRIGSVPLDGAPVDLEVVGSFAYLAARLSLEIVDVTDPTAPQLVRTLASRAYAIAQSGGQLYVGTQDGTLEIYDLGDPDDPMLLGSVPLGLSILNTGYELDLDGAVLYATALGGLRDVDLSDPRAPQVIGSFDQFFLESAAVSGDLLYVGFVGGGVLIVDVSDPTQLRQIGHFGRTIASRDLEVVGDRLYVAGGFLRVFDLSDPIAPKLMGGVVASNEIEVSAGIAYAVRPPLFGFTAIDFGPEYAPPLDVKIDVSPFDPHDRVVPGKKRPLAVGLFGSVALDVRDIDRDSLALGPGQAPALHAFPTRLDRDRHKDLAALFWIPDTGIALGDTQVCLTARALTGRRLRRCDTIQTLSGCGGGYALALLVPFWLPLRRAILRATR